MKQMSMSYPASIVRLFALDKAVKCRGPRLERSREIRGKVVVAIRTTPPVGGLSYYNSFDVQ